MHRKGNTVKIKGFYSVSEIAACLGVDRKKAFRLLARSGLIVVGTNRKQFVWISDLQDREPRIFASMAYFQAVS